MTGRRSKGWQRLQSTSLLRPPPRATLPGKTHHEMTGLEFSGLNPSKTNKHTDRQRFTSRTLTSYIYIYKQLFVTSSVLLRHGPFLSLAVCCPMWNPYIVNVCVCVCVFVSDSASQPRYCAPRNTPRVHAVAIIKISFRSMYVCMCTHDSATECTRTGKFQDELDDVAFFSYNTDKWRFVLSNQP